MGLAGSPQKSSSPERKSWWNLLQSKKRGKPAEKSAPITPLEFPPHAADNLAAEPELASPCPTQSDKAPRQPPLAPAAHVAAPRARPSAFNRRPTALLKVPTLIDSPVNSPNLKRQRLRTPSTDGGARTSGQETKSRILVEDMALDLSAIEAQTQALRVAAATTNQPSEPESARGLTPVPSENTVKAPSTVFKQRSSQVQRFEEGPNQTAKAASVIGDQTPDLGQGERAVKTRTFEAVSKANSAPPRIHSRSRPELPKAWATELPLMPLPPGTTSKKPANSGSVVILPMAPPRASTTDKRESNTARFMRELTSLPDRVAALEKVVDSILPCFGTGVLPLTARVERLEMALGIRPVFSLDLNSRLDNVEARHKMEEESAEAGCEPELEAALDSALEATDQEDDTPLRRSEPAVFQTPPFAGKGVNASTASQIPSFSLFDDNASPGRNSVM